ncbi:hypothetical protein LY76DRAFT_47194 [Colletotrichum caudatum]|nr:hypothetical protein LY76DRAFT_47194 [Colletotrichum caudatum]
MVGCAGLHGIVTRRRLHLAAATTPPFSCRPSHLSSKVPFPGLVSANELREPHRLPHNPDNKCLQREPLNASPFRVSTLPSGLDRWSAEIQAKKWSLLGYDQARMQHPLRKGSTQEKVNITRTCTWPSLNGLDNPWHAAEEYSRRISLARCGAVRAGLQSGMDGIFSLITSWSFGSIVSPCFINIVFAQVFYTRVSSQVRGFRQRKGKTDMRVSIGAYYYYVLYVCGGRGLKVCVCVLGLGEGGGGGVSGEVENMSSLQANCPMLP